MAFREHHALWIGQWVGSKRLWLSWLPDPERASPTQMTIAAEAGDRFLTLRYQWAYEGAAQAGTLMFGVPKEDGVATGAWCDSWHMGDRLMFLTGELGDDALVSLRGSYPAGPDSPDWGWRVELSVSTSDGLSMRMFNINPQGGEELAVQADLRKV